MTLELLKETVTYVTGNPYFWGSMGFTVAIAMFAGVLIYDGHLNQVKRGLVSVLSYACMLFTVNAFRVIDTVRNPLFSFSTTEPYRVYASLVSLVIVTLAWLLGLILGVCLFKHKYKDVDSL